MDKKSDYTEFKALLENMTNSAKTIVYDSISPDKHIWVKRLLVVTVADTLFSIGKTELAEQALIEATDILNPTEEEKEELQKL